MLWERAKNLTILFFLMLNLALAAVLYTERSRYVLTQEQERAIYTVLSQNKISMYSKMIRQYNPLRPLSVSGYHYNTDALLPMFFTEPEKVTRLIEPGKEIFEENNTRLVISNGYISYDNPAGTGYTATRTEAVAACDTFIKRFFPLYRLDDNQQDATQPDEDGLRLCYREMYKESMVYSNFIEFYVTENGITQIDMQYSEVSGFSGLAQEICAPDEALLTFIQRIRVIYGSAPVLITKMDVVYYQDEFSTQENVSLLATPYYRIFIERQDIPFMVNAYTNIMK